MEGKEGIIDIWGNLESVCVWGGGKGGWEWRGWNLGKIRSAKRYAERWDYRGSELRLYIYITNVLVCQ